MVTEGTHIFIIDKCEIKAIKSNKLLKPLGYLR